MQITVSTIHHDERREIISGFEGQIIDGTPLTGTPKQIAWAEKIRDAAVKDYLRAGPIAMTKVGDRWLKHFGRVTPEVTAALATINEGCAKMAEALSTKTSAAAWIDAAGGSTPSLLTIRKIMGR